MRRARALHLRDLLAIGVLLAVLSGCGRRDDARPSGEGDLSFERLTDTTGLSAGAPIVQDFDAYRMDSRAMRVKGKTSLPDGAHVRVAIKRPGESFSLAMVQLTVQDGVFDSPPILGEHGPLPVAPYVFEISSQFTPEWQTPEVLRATSDGRSLRGPGVTRTRIGGAMFWQTLEMTR